MVTTLIARRVAKNVPIWNILAGDGFDIGALTHLPMERGPMATVRYGMDCSEEGTTFTGSTIREVLHKVRVYVDEMDRLAHEEANAEYYNEVIAPMKAAEARAERGYDYHDEYCW